MWLSAGRSLLPCLPCLGSEKTDSLAPVYARHVYTRPRKKPSRHTHRLSARSLSESAPSATSTPTLPKASFTLERPSQLPVHAHSASDPASLWRAGQPPTLGQAIVPRFARPVFPSRTKYQNVHFERRMSDEQAPAAFVTSPTEYLRTPTYVGYSLPDIAASSQLAFSASTPSGEPGQLNLTSLPTDGAGEQPQHARHASLQLSTEQPIHHGRSLSNPVSGSQAMSVPRDPVFGHTDLTSHLASPVRVAESPARWLHRRPASADDSAATGYANKSHPLQPWATSFILIRSSGGVAAPAGKSSQSRARRAESAAPVRGTAVVLGCSPPAAKQPLSFGGLFNPTIANVQPSSGHRDAASGALLLLDVAGQIVVLLTCCRIAGIAGEVQL